MLCRFKHVTFSIQVNAIKHFCFPFGYTVEYM